MTKDEALAFDLALEALEETLKTLDDANAIPGGPIADTIWYSPYETLFDYLEVRIAAIKQARSAPTSAEYAMGYAEGFNDGCKPTPVQEPVCIYPRCSCNSKDFCDPKRQQALDKKAENARELGLDYEPVAPVQEDWGPGPHECHSLTASVQEEVPYVLVERDSSGKTTVSAMPSSEVLGHNGWGFPIKAAAPVQEPVAWRYRGILHDFDPSDWAEGPVTPLYTTPPAQPAPVQEPKFWYDQEEGLLHDHFDDSPFGCIPLYTTPPAAPMQEPVAEVLEDMKGGGYVKWLSQDFFVPGTKLYTAAQRQWVGLTDAEVMQTMSGDWTSQFYFARAIEAKLRSKNNG